MNPLVSETVGSAAGFPTFVTLEVFLSHVDSLVPVEVGALSEAIPTFGAGVGLLTRVCPLVFNQGGTLAEALPAFLALVGFLPRVDSLVFKKVRTLFETLLTVVTSVRLFFTELPLGLRKTCPAGMSLNGDRALRFRPLTFYQVSAFFPTVPLFVPINGPLSCLDVWTRKKV